MTMQQKYLLAKRMFLLCLAATFMVFIYWFITRPSGLNYTILCVQILPLAVFIPGILANHYRTYSWVCFLLLFYFIKAVEGVFISTATLSDGLFLLLTPTLFIISMMASHWAQRLQAQANR